MAHTYLAEKTIAWIDAVIEQDGGNLYRHYLKQVILHIGDAYRQEQRPFRRHMGASMIGRKCAREIWYSFHWTVVPTFPGRILRLFNRGHLEEARFIAMLLAIGCQVYQQDEKGDQFRIDYANGHGGGSGDGIVDGCPDVSPGTRLLAEFKTHNEKSFNSLKKEGVRSSKHEHYVQSNMYAYKMGLPGTLYMGVNKNTDELYAEILPVDTETAERYIHRGEKIVAMEQAPERISENPSWYECKFCDFRPVCHKGADPVVNCRTCANSLVSDDGTWKCNVGFSPVTLSEEQQYAACDKWVKNHQL